MSDSRISINRYRADDKLYELHKTVNNDYRLMLNGEKVKDFGFKVLAEKWLIKNHSSVIHQDFVAIYPRNKRLI